MKNIRLGTLFFLLSCAVPFAGAGAQGISLSQQETRWIGEMVFKNECAFKERCLVQWNEGEDFISLGIGHFIWYPKGRRGPFKDSFPCFIDYAKGAGQEVPGWLDTKPFPPCPWHSRKDFLNNQEDPRLSELRGFLMATKPLQAAFIVKRLEEALPLIVNNFPEEDREKITLRFNRVATTPSGVYALADYVNFKGLGVAASERYKNKGWGLSQVLREMKDEEEAPDALKEFVRAADKVLTERVANAPKRRNEQRWLPGWRNRISTYLNKQEPVSYETSLSEGKII
ncbi:MAG: hypothetical protein WC301_00820 [Candidatus Omnitrophota bacterium]|jgi:hypothetical protein